MKYQIIKADYYPSKLDGFGIKIDLENGNRVLIKLTRQAIHDAFPDTTTTDEIIRSLNIDKILKKNSKKITRNSKEIISIEITSAEINQFINAKLE